MTPEEAVCIVRERKRDASEEGGVVRMLGDGHTVILALR